jgi:hypothetical protein
MQFLKGDSNDSCTLDYANDKWEDENIWKMSLGMYILSVFKYYDIYDENIANCLLDFLNIERFCNIMYFLNDKKEDVKKYLNIKEEIIENTNNRNNCNTEDIKKDILDNYLEKEMELLNSTNKIQSPQNKVNNSNKLEDTINILNIKYKINSNKDDTNINNNIVKSFPKKVTLGNAYLDSYNNGIRKINKKDEMKFLKNTNKSIVKKDYRKRNTNKEEWDSFFDKDIEISIYKEENKIHKICNEMLENQYNCYNGLINIGKYIIDNNISTKNLYEEIFDNFIDKYKITGTILNHDKNNSRFKIKCIRLYKLSKYIKIQDLIKLKIIKKITDMDETLFLYILDKFKDVKIKYI